MTYQLAWYVEKRVLYIRWPEVLTLEALKEANDEIVTYLDAGTPLVHTIQDTSSMAKYPSNLLKLHQTLTFLRHPALGWVLAVSHDPMVVFLGTVLPQMSGRSRTRVFRTMADLLAFIEDQDRSVDWTSADPSILRP